MGGGGADLARRVWHRADDFRGRQDHSLELEDCNSGEDADEELAFQGFFHSGLAEDRIGDLGLAAAEGIPIESLRSACGCGEGGNGNDLTIAR